MTTPRKCNCGKCKLCKRRKYQVIHRRVGKERLNEADEQRMEVVQAPGFTLIDEHGREVNSAVYARQLMACRR